MGRFLPPDHSKGDERTIGGYMAVHARPAAFEGTDGASYSVEIETDHTGDEAEPWAAFLLFVRWTRGQPRPAGHLETDYLARGASEDEVRSAVGALPLERVKSLLDDLIRAAWPDARPWWEAMRENGTDQESG